MSDRPNQQQRIYTWWRELDERRGDRAELRRAASLQDVVFCQGFHRLLNTIPTSYNNHVDEQSHIQRLTLITGVLAHIKEDLKDAHSLAHLLSTPSQKSTNAAMSGLRFRRLMSNRRLEDAFRPLVQSLGLIHHNANVHKLSLDLYWWESDHPDSTRYQWTRDYYRNAPQED